MIAAVTPRGVKVTTAAGASGEEAVTLEISANSTYAYLLARPAWDGDELSSFTTDQWGL